MGVGLDLHTPLMPWPRWFCNLTLREWQAQADARRRCTNRAAIAWEDAADIRREYFRGCMRIPDLSTAYDVSQQTIRDIVRGPRRKDGRA